MAKAHNTPEQTKKWLEKMRKRDERIQELIDRGERDG